MGIEEYVHELGARLDDCTTGEERVQIAQLLALTGSPDAQPYLLDAIAEETDEAVRTGIRQALADLSSRVG